MSVTAYDGEITDFRLRRSIITDAWSNTARRRACYVDEVDGLLLEDNVFDHNGWNTDVCRRRRDDVQPRRVMSARNDNVVIRGNVIADSSSHGLRPARRGVIEDNLFLRNPINMTVRRRRERHGGRRQRAREGQRHPRQPRHQRLQARHGHRNRQHQGRR
jgi:hypothetical protein